MAKGMSVVGRERSEYGMYGGGGGGGEGKGWLAVGLRRKGEE